MQLATIERLLYPVEREVNPINRKQHFLINGVSGKRIATVTDKYRLVHNRDLVEPLLDKFGPEAFTMAYEHANGSFQFKVNTGRSFEIGNDRLDEQFIFGNSYNKSRSEYYMGGAFKFLCANGMFTGRAIINIRRKHLGNQSTRAQVVDALARYRDNGFELWKSMADVKLGKRHMINLASSMPLLDENEKITHRNRVIERNNLGKWWKDPMPRTNDTINKDIRRVAISKILRETTDENPETAWGLLNQVNWAIERVLNRSEVAKKITANIKAEDSIANAFQLN